MTDLSKKVLRTIDKYGMTAPAQTVIAAVSGGYDSICMLHILKELMPLRKFDVCVAHVNHCLRTEADSDMQFVESAAKRLRLLCHTVKIDVAAYADDNKISIETAGREVRYKYFNEIAERYPSAVVATAHNANDGIESFFMHLMRGCGLAGLTGIKAKRGNIIRPLIEVNREEIERFCRENSLPIVQDITNFSDEFTRNDIRHSIVAPMLERCSTDCLSRTMCVLSDEEDFLQNYTRTVICDYVNYNKIDVKKFNRLHIAVKRRILREIIPKPDVGLVHIDSCINLAEKNYGNKVLILPGGTEVKISKGILTVGKVQTNLRGD